MVGATPEGVLVPDECASGGGVVSYVVQAEATQDQGPALLV